MMRGPRRILATTAVFLCSLAAGRAHAGGVLDQSNVVSTFTFDAAVVSEVSRGQTFTVGLAGELSQVNLEIYKFDQHGRQPDFRDPRDNRWSTRRYEGPLPDDHSPERHTDLRYAPHRHLPDDLGQRLERGNRRDAG